MLAPAKKRARHFGNNNNNKVNTQQLRNRISTILVNTLTNFALALQNAPGIDQYNSNALYSSDQTIAIVTKMTDIVNKLKKSDRAYFAGKPELQVLRDAIMQIISGDAALTLKVTELDQKIKLINKFLKSSNKSNGHQATVNRTTMNQQQSMMAANRQRQLMMSANPQRQAMMANRQQQSMMAANRQRQATMAANQQGKASTNLV